MFQELEENEEDLVSEIENLTRENQSLEVENHEQKCEREGLQMTLAELTRMCDNSNSELELMRRKFDAEKRNNDRWTV